MTSVTIHEKENTALQAQPSPNDVDAWRKFLVSYYLLNCPNKAKMVDDKMMSKFEGKFETLYKKLINKYGEPGFPIKQPSLASAAPARLGGGKNSNVGSHHNQFVSMIEKVAKSIPPTVVTKKESTPSGPAILETSTFTVCLRIRPILHDEITDKGENFTCIIPGQVSIENGQQGTEEAIICKPSVGITGKPKIDIGKSFKYDHVFGPTREGEEVFNCVGRPLVDRAMAGQVGVVFAFGQTGSGKTHTMNGLMSRLATELFSGSESCNRTITFSYMEMLGRNINDCLVNTNTEKNDNTDKKVQVGELLDGRSVVKNLSVHPTPTADSLAALFDVAKARRSTAATEKNATSSRSHGVGIIRIGHKGYSADEGPAEGIIYVIDLAGSERAADSKDHSKERMEETKEINLSLMSLKECIRARTMASSAGGDLHVPYRRSKLTLLMKDVFDIGCSRMCTTIVLAHVTPTFKDLKHSTNTINYSAPLRVAVTNNSKKKEVDLRDPVNWSNDQIVTWLNEVTEEEIDINALLLTGVETGLDLCQISEVEIYRRLSESPKIARLVYQSLWTLICDAKVRKRRPDGTIITAEQEAEEIRVAKENLEKKKAVWAEREKHMRSEH